MVCLVELTVCYDTLFQEAVQRKEDQYCDLLQSISQAGYTGKLITIEVGAHGLPNIIGFLKLKTEFGLSKSEVESLMVEAGRQAISGSFRIIWCLRNKISMPSP